MSKQFGDADYWDERYTLEPEPFDWWQRYEGLKGILDRMLQPTSKVLVVGAGTSRLIEEIYENHSRNITNIDFSGVCVQLMKAKHGDKQDMQWVKMDVRTLAFADATFDVVIDKATMDAVLCGDSSTKNCYFMFKEISRVLKPGGTCLTVSHGRPDSRRNFMDKQEFNWEVVDGTIPKPTASVSSATAGSENVHFTYTMTKSS